MKVLVTGAHGFIGKNLAIALAERPGFEVLPFARNHPASMLTELVAQADAVIHLAGENRPSDPAAFDLVNADLTRELCKLVEATDRPIPFAFASSTQAELDNPYGRSKRAGEIAVDALSKGRSGLTIFRLPGVFGKWCKPNYNSVVATFCHNIARGLPIQISDPDVEVRLAYIDDVVAALIESITSPPAGLTHRSIEPTYVIRLGDLARQIEAFPRSRETLLTERVGVGLTRALYSTYLSYLPVESFAYDVPRHGDARGEFVEMLKTADSGQFSFFTAHPGVTRGGHYHHSKTEKFLVIRGRARFGFRHMSTGDRHTIETSGASPQIVETVPGWSHDITNIGDEEMIVMLWANEIFDRSRPDTVAAQV